MDLCLACRRSCRARARSDFDRRGERSNPGTFHSNLPEVPVREARREPARGDSLGEGGAAAPEPGCGPGPRPHPLRAPAGRRPADSDLRHRPRAGDRRLRGLLSRSGQLGLAGSHLGIPAQPGAGPELGCHGPQCYSGRRVPLPRRQGGLPAVPGADEPEQGSAPGDRCRSGGGAADSTCRQAQRAGRESVLRGRDRAPPGARRVVDRGSRRGNQKGSPGPSARLFVPHQVGRALRHRDGRSHGLRNPGCGASGGVRSTRL